MKTQKYIYKWIGLNHQGIKIKGKLHALNSEHAKQILQKQNMAVLTTRKAIQVKFYLFNKKISAREISIFLRQLSTLICTGIPIISALQILLENQKKIQLHQLINDLIAAIKSGQTLSFSLQHYPNYFNALTRHLIKIGEQSGTMDVMLTRIADQKEKQIQIKESIQLALLYPTVITFISAIMTVVMLVLVIPKFAELFETFHGKLPYFTLKIIQLSAFFRCSIPYFFFTVILLTPVLMWSRHYFKYHLITDKLLLTIPLLKEFYLKILSANFSRVFAVMMCSGIPITDAMKLLKDLSPNSLYQQAITQLTFEITSGQRLYDAMRRCAFFPDLLIQMIKVGEESGTLDTMLAKSAEFYESDINQSVSHFTQLLEPLIIIILGVLIGGLVIAMYLPIFKLGTVI
ncbi:MAG: type II secretion system F family protein [Gammaproteobacteria bacterium]|nr:type II secretion system F family protein [Gammaproteobacteria bacterium]